jgi:orotidine-5'-phosphate decarboxylase
MSSASRILLPLDFDNADQAVDIARVLHTEIAGFKVGLELINAAGFDIFERLNEAAGREVPIFYDCKLHDIPNTVAGAVRAITKRGVWMFNVHASGGSQMMLAAVNAANETSGNKPLVIAVTVLTSISEEIAQSELGIGRPLAEQVVSLARLAQDAGCDGVVASPKEAAAIRQACGSDFVLVIPGVRPAGADLNDQKRVLTPGDAVKQGADYIVVGRPITAASDPLAAAKAINAETSAAVLNES